MITTRACLLPHCHVKYVLFFNNAEKSKLFPRGLKELNLQHYSDEAKKYSKLFNVLSNSKVCVCQLKLLLYFVTKLTGTKCVGKITKTLYNEVN